MSKPKFDEEVDLEELDERLEHLTEDLASLSETAQKTNNISLYRHVSNHHRTFLGELAFD